MTDLTEDLAARIESLAIDLAQLAGAEITTALGRDVAVRYKGVGADHMVTDPVSEVDAQVEDFIRDRVGRGFPDHGIVGEEIDTPPDPDKDIVWAIDPIDGTANFVNGFPLFAASIGVSHQGRPIAGAVWCSTSHRLRPGVYHARIGGELRFEYEPAAARAVSANRRYLVGEPDLTPGEFPWDMRKTGSAAIECAFVAAGLLRGARLEGPNIWDVAGGLALVRATNAVIKIKGETDWSDFDHFAAGDSLRNWKGSLVLGEATTVDTMIAALDSGRSASPRTKRRSSRENERPPASRRRGSDRISRSAKE